MTFAIGDALETGSYLQALTNGAYAVIRSSCDASDIERMVVRALRHSEGQVTADRRWDRI